VLRRRKRKRKRMRRRRRRRRVLVSHLYLPDMKRRTAHMLAVSAEEVQ